MNWSWSVSLDTSLNHMFTFDAAIAGHCLEEISDVPVRYANDAASHDGYRPSSHDAEISNPWKHNLLGGPYLGISAFSRRVRSARALHPFLSNDLIDLLYLQLSTLLADSSRSLYNAKSA